MNVLFVAGGNSVRADVPELVRNQGDSLQKCDINVSYFAVTGKGLLGYLKNIGKLRSYVKNNNIDLIHAHYSYTGILCTLSFCRKPIVVSFLGSDVHGKSLVKWLIRQLSFLWNWKAVIVKSKEMISQIRFHGEIHLIPNGVNLDHFIPMDSYECKKVLGWNVEKQQVLFMANPTRPEKNFELFIEAFEQMNLLDFEVKTLENVDRRQVPVWLNAADYTVLSSLWEGSPNVIKEAMACNKIIVTTDVGDVKWLLSDGQGFFVAQPSDFPRQLDMALRMSLGNKSSDGRARLMKLGLDSDAIALRLKAVYENVLNNN